MTTKTTPKAQTFNMKLPLLAEGRSDHMLARTEVVTIRGKVYAQGGENALHSHIRQDHAFFILSGEATFHTLGAMGVNAESAEQDPQQSDDNLTVLGPLEGILLPAGAYYWFQSTGDENLVMLRLSGKVGPDDERVGDDRVDIDGNSFPGDHPDNKGIVPVPNGRVFGG